MPFSFRPALSLLACIALPALAAGDFVAIKPEQARALAIATRPAEAGGRGLAQGLPATVSIPNEQIRVISAPLAGVVEALETAPGLAVKKGQVLVRMASPQALELQRDATQARAQTRLAEQTLARDEQLFREGLIAESRLQAARSQAEQARAMAAERADSLRLAQVGRGQSIALAAPIDGVVLEQQAAVGQRVDQAAPLYRIARLNPLWLEIQAPVAIAADLRTGTRVSVPSAQAEGALIAVGRAVNPGSQSVLLRARIDRGAERLRPGQAVEASLDVAAAGQGVAVPAGAIVHNQGGTYVFVAAVENKQSGFRAVPVKMLGRAGDKVLVSGPAAGAQVAVQGVSALKAGWMGLSGE